jgi:hypothetical protein
VSFPGQFMRGRMAIPFLRQVGGDSLIANTQEEFMTMVCDSDRIKQAGENLDPAALFRDPTPVKALDEFLLSLPGNR